MHHFYERKGCQGTWSLALTLVGDALFYILVKCSAACQSLVFDRLVSVGRLIIPIVRQTSSCSPESDSLWWDAFASEFFEEDATLTLSFCLEDGPKRYSKAPSMHLALPRMHLAPPSMHLVTTCPLVLSLHRVLLQEELWRPPTPSRRITDATQ
ncbi:unnamed protein product [Boreogadus saida]